MEILVSRNSFQPDHTTGAMFINGQFKFVTLEDKDRGLDSTDELAYIKEDKIYGRTAIPVGRYKIAKHFWTKHGRVAPKLLDVPGFEGILIHSGVTANDTLGCILVGKKIFQSSLTNSRDARMELDKLIFDALDRKEEVWITIERVNYIA